MVVYYRENDPNHMVFTTHTGTWHLNLNDIKVYMLAWNAKVQV